MRAAAQRLERVPARAAAEVEHPVTGTNPEPGEIDGQHGAAPPREAPRRELPCREVFHGEVPAAGPPPSSAPAAASAPALPPLAIARRYCSTVARATAGQANRSCTRRSARADSRSRLAAESCSLRSATASSSAPPGVTRGAASPVTPATAPFLPAFGGGPEP